MKSKLKRLRRSSKLTSSITDKHIENAITKVIERKMRGSHIDFNLFARNITNHAYRNSGRDIFGLMHPSHSDSGFNFGHTSGQVLAALAQSIQKAMLRNL